MSISYFAKTIRYLWSYSKIWIICLLLIRIILGLLPVSSVIITANLVNEVTLYIQNPSYENTKIYYLLLIQLTILVVQPSLTNIINIINVKFERKLEYALSKDIALKSSEVPILYFDNHNFHNHLERIYHDKANRLMSPIKLIFNILQNIISLSSLLIFLISVHWTLALLGTLSSIPTLIVQMYYGNKHYHMLKFLTPTARLAMYTSSLLSDRESANEVRLYNLKEYLISKWSKFFMHNETEIMNLTKRKETAYIWLHISAGILYTIALYFLIQLIKSGTKSIGSFVSSTQAILQTQSTINDLSTNFAQLYSEQLYIQDLFNFLEFEDPEVRKYSGELNFPERLYNTIEFKNVSFKYPLRQNLTLDNISFSIKAGERIAIVGENGSGKTTLVKCLMGLFPIDKGDITFDGISINDIKIEDLYKNITPIFQNYSKYNYSIKENIFLKDSDKVTQEQLLNIALKTGVNTFVSKFKEGYETILGKVYIEGEDLSGGQWQKVAISRALHKKGQIYILDEPTAALDPLSEIDVFNQFDELTRGKTTIFISHRMASARLADRIFVLKNGKLIEQGSHHDLIKTNSNYSKMFNSQAKWYA